MAICIKCELELTSIDSSLKIPEHKSAANAQSVESAAIVCQKGEETANTSMAKCVRKLITQLNAHHTRNAHAHTRMGEATGTGIESQLQPTRG